MQSSSMSILVIRRIQGPEETYQAYMGYAGWQEMRKIEPSFRVNLDGKKIGAIGPLTRMDGLLRHLLPPPPKEKSSQFEIPAGHHDLTINVTRQWSYLGPPLTSSIQSFDITPGEIVTFFCQYAPVKRTNSNASLRGPNHMILLQQDKILPR